MLATMKERRFCTYSLESEGKRARETLTRAYTCERVKRMTETRASFFPERTLQTQTLANVTEMKNRLVVSCRLRELPTSAGKRFM